jgi:hypothetical protein
MWGDEALGGPSSFYEYVIFVPVATFSIVECDPARQAYREQYHWAVTV